MSARIFQPCFEKWWQSHREEIRGERSKRDVGVSKEKEREIGFSRQP